MFKCLCYVNMNLEVLCKLVIVIDSKIYLIKNL